MKSPRLSKLTKRTTVRVLKNMTTSRERCKLRQRKPRLNISKSKTLVVEFKSKKLTMKQKTSQTSKKLTKKPVDSKKLKNQRKLSKRNGSTRSLLSNMHQRKYKGRR